MRPATRGARATPSSTSCCEGRNVDARAVRRVESVAAQRLCDSHRHIEVVEDLGRANRPRHQTAVIGERPPALRGPETALVRGRDAFRHRQLREH